MPALEILTQTFQPVMLCSRAKKAFRLPRSSEVSDNGLLSMYQAYHFFTNHLVSNPRHTPACHLCSQEHWLTVRRVNGSWYNFNSLFSAPELLGTLYLTTFLATLRGEGYSIFVVQGRLPNPHPEAGSRDSIGCWFTPDEVNQTSIKQD